MNMPAFWKGSAALALVSWVSLCPVAQAEEPFTLPYKGEIQVPLDSKATPSPSPASAPKAAVSEPAVPAATPAEPRETVDALSDADTRQALDLLRAHYLDTTALKEAALDRATLQGLLQRLGGGAAIVTPAAAPATPAPFRAEVLDDTIGYVRIGSLSADNLAPLDAALARFREKQIGSLILDLRGVSGPAAPSNDWEQAALWLNRLAPKGKMLFSLRRPNAKQERMFTSDQEPAFQGILVTLVNRTTSGAAETVAASLRSLANALVVGQKTAGAAAEFTELPLHGGKVLRVAVGEIRLPGDRSIFPGGLVPDLPVAVAPAVEAEALRLGVEKGVSSLVYPPERTRLNEAALVAGVNPELDAAEAEQRPGYQKADPAPTDPALQRAVDLVTTVRIFSQNR
jgi:hypothetical protein